MRKQNRNSADRFGKTNLGAKLAKVAVPQQRDIRHKGEVALSLLALACENMARGWTPSGFYPGTADEPIGPQERAAAGLI